MVLDKRIFLNYNSMKFYFVFIFLIAFVYCDNAQRRFSNSSNKSMIVQEILKKVSNITNSISNSAPEKKATILNKIETKLRNSAKSLGPDADKYIKFIMDEFKTKSKEVVKEQHNVSKVLRKNINNRMEKPATTTSIHIDSDTKQEIIKDITQKIQTLAKGFMKDAKTIEGKKQVMEKIKRRIMESANQKHIQLHHKHDELKTYSGFIQKGLEESMRKMLADEGDARRMETEVETGVGSLEHKVGAIVKTNDTHAEEDDMVKKTMVVMDIAEISKYKDMISQSFNDTATDSRCDEIVKDTCIAIQSFNRIPCGEGRSIPIEHLCDGVIDCLNQVDEVNCTIQALEKVRKATTVMTDIETSLNRKCFASTDGNVLTAQNQVLRDVLNTQMDFLEKKVEGPLKDIENKDRIKDEIFIKKTVTDVNMILSTLSYALDGTLCAHRFDPDHLGNNVFRKFNELDLDELDETPKYPNWSAKSCTCKGQFCKDMECEAPCKRVCWQRYSLNHWGCQALNSATSVSLNVICDGKLDCFDETDESFCSTDAKHSKFEAKKSYSDLLDLLKTKSKSLEFEKSRNKFISLHGLVYQLMKHTIKTNTDLHLIKSLRDESFLKLVSIYDDLLQTAGLSELDDRYLILLSINEKLVTALKRSNAGNENFISSDGCYCRDGLCTMSRCNKNCIQACLVEPKLTRYSCDANKTVPLEAICDEKENCPNGEDEEDCVEEICRGHHLVVLRHNLQNVAAKYGGSVMGEVLEAWKSKVSAALFIEETNGRPNHKKMVDIINRVLHDLVKAFAAMVEYRKTNSEYALQEFIAVSKIVMNTLKTCSN